MLQPQWAREQEWANEGLSDRCRGWLSWQEVAELYFWLDEDANLDYLYIFFGVPNGRIRLVHRQKLNQADIEIGTSKSNVAGSVSFEAAYKYAKEKRFG